jgi:hypothetical protein
MPRFTDLNSYRLVDCDTESLNVFLDEAFGNTFHAFITLSSFCFDLAIDYRNWLLYGP